MNISALSLPLKNDRPKSRWHQIRQVWTGESRAKQRQANRGWAFCTFLPGKNLEIDLSCLMHRPCSETLSKQSDRNW